MVFGVYKDKMIRMIKRSLYGVIVCKKWFNIFIWENVCTTRKTKIIKTRILKDISEFDWSKNGNVFDWHRKHIHEMFFFFNFLILFIAYIDAELMKPCLASRARNLVFSLLFYCSLHRRLLLQSMQNSSKYRLNMD